MNGSELDPQSAARARVGTLAVLSQSDDPGVEADIEHALREATDNGWIDVRLALIHVQVLYFQLRDPSRVGVLIQEIEREADRHGLRAMKAIALIDRIRVERDAGVQRSYQAFATARVLLSDREQPVLDRVSGLINLSLQLELAGLSEIADDTLRDAVAAATELPDSGEPLAVISHNRSRALLRRAAWSLIVGDEVRAHKLLDRYSRIVDDIETDRLPPGWMARLFAHRRIIELLLADDDLGLAEAEQLISSLDATDAGDGVVVRLMTPRASWPSSALADLSELEEEHVELAAFLHVRACRRAGIRDEELIVALDRFNSVLSARADHTRVELEAGIAAMISSQRLSAERHELVTQAMTDALTGLANRRSFQDRLERHLDHPATLVLIDLDHFKAVNDSYGHDVGDQVLVKISTALNDAAQRFAPDSVARIGGDEMAVLLRGERVDAAERLADAFEQSLQTIDWGLVLPSPTASVGIASATCRDTLFRHADLDLYKEKQRKASNAQPS